MSVGVLLQGSCAQSGSAKRRNASARRSHSGKPWAAAAKREHLQEECSLAHSLPVARFFDKAVGTLHFRDCCLLSVDVGVRLPACPLAWTCRSLSSKCPKCFAATFLKRRTGQSWAPSFPSFPQGEFKLDEAVPCMRVKPRVELGTAPAQGACLTNVRDSRNLRLFYIPTFPARRHAAVGVGHATSAGPSWL